MRKEKRQGDCIMLQMKIDKNNKKQYLYKQVYENIKKLIIENKLLPNEQLPSKRMLAEQLAISINSVTSAYEQLLAEGYIYTIERSGYFVENLMNEKENYILKSYN